MAVPSRRWREGFSHVALAFPSSMGSLWPLLYDAVSNSLNFKYVFPNLPVLPFPFHPWQHPSSPVAPTHTIVAGFHCRVLCSANLHFVGQMKYCGLGSGEIEVLMGDIFFSLHPNVLDCEPQRPLSKCHC